MVFHASLGFGAQYRAAIAVLLLVPLGLLLGMPFPTGLRILGEERQSLVPWAWGVNAFFTVVVSVAAVILGMAFGFTVVLALAAACLRRCTGGPAFRRPVVPDALGFRTHTPDI